MKILLQIETNPVKMRLSSFYPAALVDLKMDYLTTVALTFIWRQNAPKRENIDFRLSFLTAERSTCSIIKKIANVYKPCFQSCGPQRDHWCWYWSWWNPCHRKSHQDPSKRNTKVTVGTEICHSTKRLPHLEVELELTFWTSSLVFIKIYKRKENNKKIRVW